MGLVSSLSRGLIGFEDGKRARQSDDEARLAREAAARRQLLQDALLSAQAGEELAHGRYWDRSPGAGRGAGGRTAAQSDAEGHRRVRDVNTQIGQAQRDKANARAPFIGARREKALGQPTLPQQIAGAPTRTKADSTAFSADSAAHVRPAQQRLDSLQLVGDSITAAVGNRRIPPKAAKTPKEWLSEVLAEHPNWPDAQVKAEARRRAGGR